MTTILATIPELSTATLLADLRATQERELSDAFNALLASHA